MRLPKNGREIYNATIVTEPAVTGWEASFDRGTTWHTPTMDAEVMTWLLNGPDFTADPTASITVAASVTPLFRVVDTPEVIVRTGERVTLGYPNNT